MQNQFGGEADSVVMARDIHQITFHGDRRQAALCQVPLAPDHYTDNERPLGELDRWFAADETGPRVAILRGAPGSGRTTLANYWVTTAQPELSGRTVLRPPRHRAGRGRA